jgi:hypothetical protein
MKSLLFRAPPDETKQRKRRRKSFIILIWLRKEIAVNFMDAGSLFNISLLNSLFVLKHGIASNLCIEWLVGPNYAGSNR